MLIPRPAAAARSLLICDCAEGSLRVFGASPDVSIVDCCNFALRCQPAGALSVATCRAVDVFAQGAAIADVAVAGSDGVAIYVHADAFQAGRVRGREAQEAGVNQGGETSERMDERDKEGAEG
jgi:hypothetical protein